jgi:Glycosyl hydrolases family 39
VTLQGFRPWLRSFATIAIFYFSVLPAFAQQSAPIDLRIDWKKVAAINRTTVTLQVVSNPPLRPGSPIYENAWKSFRELKPAYARLALWYPYPRLAVAEISPPSSLQTFWDFSNMDPLVENFFRGVGKRPSVLSIATAPQWMFSSAPVEVPRNPDEPVWNYEQGSALRDGSLREISDYYERVARWYLKGGFRDERGVRHSSGHHYKPAYWEVFNEPEYEHNFTAAQYTQIYDAVTARLLSVDRNLKFTGMSLAVPDKGEEFLNYFLDHSHHASGARLDAISYHFYAHGKRGETPETQAVSFFQQADQFLDTVKKVEAIRQRLSPETETQINETGCIGADDSDEGSNKMGGIGIPSFYWNLCGAVFSYAAARLAEDGIQVVGASQLLGYPSQYPTVSLLDWTTGLPNARYQSLLLLMRNLQPGDRLGDALNRADLYSLPITKKSGARILLLINKTPRELHLVLSGDPSRWKEQHVDTTSAGATPHRGPVSGEVLLGPFAVMVLTGSK